MSRRAAVVVHVPLVLIAGVLYFFFVLPRWPELSYETSHTLGTVLRITAGVLFGLAALPVVFSWLRARKPEYGTPQLALTLRVVSIALHVLGGALIVGTAISEIWLSLDDAGRWLFGIYGAAAAIILLGIAAFYLAFVAELPPPPPKPLKAKSEKKQRRSRKERKAKAAVKKAEGADDKAEDESEEPSSDEAADDTDKPTATPSEDEKPAEVTAKAETASADEEKPTAADEVKPPAEATEPTAEAKGPATEATEPTAEDQKPATEAKEPPATEKEPQGDKEPATEETLASEPVRGGRLRNRRPSAKTGGSRWRRKSGGGGGVAVED